MKGSVTSPQLSYLAMILGQMQADRQKAIDYLHKKYSVADVVELTKDQAKEAITFLQRARFDKELLTI